MPNGYTLFYSAKIKTSKGLIQGYDGSVRKDACLPVMTTLEVKCKEEYGKRFYWKTS
jgi:hypothetical protein